MTQTSAVLWARANKPGVVTFQISSDPGFHHVIGSRAVSVADSLVPAKVLIDGLHPDQRYYYRAVDAVGHIAEGTLETAPKLGQHEGFAFGAAGDAQGALAPYPSITNAPTAGLDVFIKLGDIPYADEPSPVGPAAQTLSKFEVKNNEIYSAHLGINSWAALQSTTPVLSILDDDEVANDFAGGALAELRSAIRRLRHLCQRLPTVPKWGDRRSSNTTRSRATPTAAPGIHGFDGKPDLYRYDIHGSDAAIFMVDTRSFRDAQLPEPSPINSPQFLAAAFDPTRSLLGGVQLIRLEHDLIDAQNKGITWKFVNISVPIENFGPTRGGGSLRRLCGGAPRAAEVRQRSSHRERRVRVCRRSRVLGEQFDLSGLFRRTADRLPVPSRSIRWRLRPRCSSRLIPALLTQAGRAAT